MSAVVRYNIEWREMSDLEIEMECIRNGGQWTEEWGVCGKGLSHHYEQMRNILWPTLHDHRWHRLIRDTILVEKCTVLAGCASSGKSHEAAWIFLSEYFCFPEETCILVSSTEIRGLRGRIWSEITMLWQRARDAYPWLAGNLLDSRVAILTDELDEEDYDRRSRDYRKCIQGVPCRESSGTWMGINRYAGWKQKRMRLIADEASQMEWEYISGVTNLNSNPDFKCVILGNFSDPMDCLGRCAEPVDGWSAHMAPMKTEVWDTFFPLKGKCINLIGFDSPNFDYPKKTPDDPDHFPEMIGPKRINEIKKAFGEQSLEFMSQCWGAMKVSTLSFRVLNKEICQAGGAFEDVNWKGMEIVKFAFLDAAWGGDRAVFTYIEVGTSVEGKTVIRCHPPEIVPVVAGPGMEADYSVAEFCKTRCGELNIPPEHFGHDSTGRGSLGTALARVWSDRCNPIEFGGTPTTRPVSLDYYFRDPKTGAQRLKLCSEHYIKFVTELWFSVRYCVEAGQLRNLPMEVYEEFALRLWRNAGDKRELEPKSGTKEKPGMKQRTGKSPDYADSLAGAIEMARRHGFQISKLSNQATAGPSWTWLKKMSEDARKKEHSHDLNYEVA